MVKEIQDSKSVEITVKFEADNLIHQEDLDNFYGDGDGISLVEFVKFLIKEEGLWGIVKDEYDIISVEECNV